MPTSTTELLHQADAHLLRGERDAALRLYRHVVQQAPGTAPAWFNIGFLHRHRGEFQPALDAYARALALGIAGAEEVHLNRAAILSEHLGRDDAAESELRAAIACAPRFAPAWLNLGNLLEERGRLEDAAATYRHLYTIAAHGAERPRALQALARLLELQLPTPEQELLAQLRQATTEPHLGTEDRASLLFALGRIDDAAGHRASAFAAFAAANRCAHANAPRYDRAGAERLLATLSAAAPPPAAHREEAAFSPVFVCGMFRSGSTLIEQVLAAHPDVTSCGELDLLPRLVRDHLPGYPGSGLALTPAQAAQLAERYRRMVLTRHPQAATSRIVTDKRPDNYLLIGLILQVFPRARIVHTVRDRLDTGLSIFMQHINPRAFAYAGRLEDIGHHIACADRLMAHWKQCFPGAIHSFDYDAFVAAPERELQALLHFLELPPAAQCLRFHELDNSVRTASLRQVRQPLHRGASGRWRHYADQLGPLRAALAGD